ncbi:MAG: hypothetical protein HYW63_01550 [Candidatus Levybacteria bacterium]|nr:hypothetical protein [Candidatus Levybacteria bacterium]
MQELENFSQLEIVHSGLNESVESLDEIIDSHVEDVVAWQIKPQLQAWAKSVTELGLFPRIPCYRFIKDGVEKTEISLLHVATVPDERDMPPRLIFLTPEGKIVGCQEDYVVGLMQDRITERGSRGYFDYGTRALRQLRGIVGAKQYELSHPK